MLFFVALLVIGASHSSFRQAELSHHFNDGDYGGFEIPKTDQESRVNIVNKRVETHWQESLYNNTNADSQNIHWRFDVSSNAFSKISNSDNILENFAQTSEETGNTTVYPNPVLDVLNVTVPKSTYSNYTLYTINRIY